jgi:hypothetical protein
MPAEQRGSLYKTSTGYGIRWRDNAGSRRYKSGFHSRSAARRWLNDLLDAGLRDERLSLMELTEQYLEAHAQVRDARTIRTLRERMKRPLDAFGDLELRDLERRAREIATWQATLPEGSRYGIMQAFRQTLEAGVRWKLIRVGTSVRVIDSTYGHLAHGSEQLARQRLDVWALSGRGGETGTH